MDQSKKAFEDAVKAILTTFGVFTGFAIKSAIEGISFPTSPSWWAFLDTLNDFHLFICIATIALLLRFIIGSAIHLNLCYVVEPRSKKPFMLFKDLAFLVVFGLFAIFMIKAPDVASFATRASLFILVGSIWSVVDFLVRLGQTEGEKTLFSIVWLLIDIIQLGLIWVALHVTQDNWWQSFWLALVFMLAFYADMKVVLAAKKG